MCGQNTLYLFTVLLFSGFTVSDVDQVTEFGNVDVVTIFLLFDQIKLEAFQGVHQVVNNEPYPCPCHITGCCCADTFLPKDNL
jgi:hypothetical protein